MPDPREARPEYPERREATFGESASERSRRNRLNRLDRKAYEAFMDMDCARCGLTRRNVRHETDREHAPEGPEYFDGVPFCEFEP
ncbi:MAG TPA: hypothetical protein VFW92_10215 [Candidatus Limnocylindrales bacterium]|nr:hypothetical protein [Candidatus Limnocylindrales bacterium]